MAAEIIQQRINQLSNARDQDELRAMLAAIIDGQRAICAKLDADAGVTDTNYVATLDAIVLKS